MSVIEFIGFIVSMAAMGFLYLKRLKENRYRAEHPEEFDEEQQAEVEALRRFLMSGRQETGESVSQRPVSPAAASRTPPPRKPVARQSPPASPAFQSSMEGYRQAAEMERRAQPSSGAKRVAMSADPYADRSSGYAEAKYEVDHFQRDSRAGALIRQQRSLQEMFILKEILGPPKSMQAAWTDPMAVPDEHR